jgi:hypothetical protein
MSHPGLGDEHGRTVVRSAMRALGESSQHAVELGQRAAMRCSDRHRGASVSSSVEEQLLARQRALLRRQRLVLEGLELRRDVALGVLQRLAPAVVVGHLVAVGAADLDVEAMHPVEFDLQVGDAGARALAGLECEQELAAVVLDAAQFVELGIVAGAITPPSRSAPPPARP